MNINLNEIRKENIKLYGTSTNHLELIGDLYSDKTHFVYEILQNAVDSNATIVRITLDRREVCIYHNGKEFSVRDVISISRIAEGTKKNDSKIGRFGIGFKSVYSITVTPKIYSGEKNFKIVDYIQPYPIDPIQIVKPFTTIISLPLKLDADYNLIRKKLENLSSRTILFLKNIETVDIIIDDEQKRTFVLKRDQRPISVQSPEAILVNLEKTVYENDQFLESKKDHWLLFNKDLHENFNNVSVQVAYKLEKKDDGNWRIIPADKTYLNVYFPTEKETKLKFLIQGPFITTPPRDNVRQDNYVNNELVEQISKLVVKTFDTLKKIKLFEVDFLNILPIVMDDFSDENMFHPIAIKVKEALQEGDFIPLSDGKFSTVADVKMPETKWLRQIIMNKQFKQLYGREYDWIDDRISENRQPDLWNYFKKELKIEIVSPEMFSQRIDNNFLTEQSINWIIRFYKQLIESKNLWSKSQSYWQSDGILRKKPIIRLQNKTHIAPFDDNDNPAVFLPYGNRQEYPKPVVHQDIVADVDAHKFLKEYLKIPVFDIVSEVIELILPRYQNDENVSFEEHKKDLYKIIEAFSTDSKNNEQRLLKKLQETKFILVERDGDLNLCYEKPSNLYFKSEELLNYFEEYDDVCFVHPYYDDSAKSLFSKLGVQKEVRVVKRAANRNNTVVIRNIHGDHKRGLNGFDPDIVVDGLKNALKNINPLKSIYIWNNIVLNNHNCISGSIESSSRKDYSDCKKEDLLSENFGQILVEYPWIYNKDKVKKRPRQISPVELLEGYNEHKKTFEILDFRENTLTELYKSINLDPEASEYYAKNPEKAKEILEKEGKEKPLFPGDDDINIENDYTNSNNKTQNYKLSSSGNTVQLSRNGENTIKDKSKEGTNFQKENNSPQRKEYNDRERSVRTSKPVSDQKEYLRKLYTNKNRELICQICKNVMPFKKNDGTYYFEAKQLLNNLKNEYEANSIATCPLCSAKFHVFIQSNEQIVDKIKQEIKLLDDKSREIQIQFGEEEETIKFVYSHINMLKNNIIDDL